MAEGVASGRPAASGSTAVARWGRWLLGRFGLEVYRARGGVFICPVPRAGRATGPARFPTPCRLHLGCGNVRLDGHVNVDIVASPATDLVADITRLDMFADGSVAEIRMSAVYEHLYRHQRRSALLEWRRVLEPGGNLRIDYIPDFEVIAEAFVNRRPGILNVFFDLDEVYRQTHGDPVPANGPEQIHKDVFTRGSVEAELAQAGFVVDRIDNVCFGDEPIALNLNVVARKPQ